MKRWTGIACAAAMVFAAACDTQRPTAPDGAGGALFSRGAQQESAGILYQLRADASAPQQQALQRLLAQFDIVDVQELVDGRVTLASVGRPGIVPIAQIAQALIATGAVSFAEVDELLEPAALPSDTLLYRQWYHRVMNSPVAWDIATGSPDVMVAVCDGGIELTHPDLAANIVGEGFNLVDYTEDGSHITSHGTKVAGMLGAVGNNVEGIAGVNWSVGILSVRVTNRTDGLAALSKLVECIDYSRGRGARAVNISYSGVRSSSSANAAGEALEAAGGLLVVSAGNDNKRETTTNYPAILVVSGTDSLDARSAFSNYGRMVDLAAPATRVTTTTLTTTVHGPYIRGENGTSFAAPLVAGAAALIWSLRPDLTPAAVKDILFRSATDLGAAGYDEHFGHGRLNVGAALTMALTATNPAPPPTSGGGKKK